MNRKKDRSRTKKRLPKGNPRTIPSAEDVERRNAELVTISEEEEDQEPIQSSDDNSEDEKKKVENVKNEKGKTIQKENESEEIHSDSKEKKREEV